MAFPNYATLIAMKQKALGVFAGKPAPTVIPLKNAVRKKAPVTPTKEVAPVKPIAVKKIASKKVVAKKVVKKK